MLTWNSLHNRYDYGWNVQSKIIVNITYSVAVSTIRYTFRQCFIVYIPNGAY